MGIFGIVVELIVKDKSREQFQDLIAENARRSVASEPGCLQFDVLSCLDLPGIMVLYEIYRDEAAFLAHLKAPHYLVFEEESENLITSKTVRRLRLQESNVHPLMEGARSGAG